MMRGRLGDVAVWELMDGNRILAAQGNDALAADVSIEPDERHLEVNFRVDWKGHYQCCSKFGKIIRSVDQASSKMSGESDKDGCHS